MIQLLFAFLAGILTVAAPCILPMLPIVLGASVGQTNKKRPLFIVLGFIISFAAASLALSLIVTHLGLSPNAIRGAAIIILLIFALFMIWPTPFELLTTKLSGLINRANRLGNSQSGNLGGFLLGLVLGLVWTPCAGPVLGSILTLIALQGTTGRAAILVIAYALGAGIPMIVIAYGSQVLTTKVRSIARYSRQLQQIFGVLILLLAVAMYFQFDTQIENNLTAFFPQSNLENMLVGQNSEGVSSGNNGANPSQAAANPPPMPIVTTNGGTTANHPTAAALMPVPLQNYGQAPEFTGITNWLNSSPLTMQSLKGKVVLVDFWTYSCINCIRTLPYVTSWYNKYKDDGFVVVGVHTPEFTFEKDTGNVQTAIKRFGITYPVAQDNNYATWQAYNNEYWPAEYLINKDGEIVHENFGEGDYDVTENAIRELLGLSYDSSAQTSTLGDIQSPEMYFEPSRLQYLTPEQQPSQQPTSYQLPATPLSLNTFALSGTWQFFSDHAQLMQPNGQIQLHFSSGKAYMVAASTGQPVTLHITVDGKAQPDVTVQASQLYTLFNSTDYSDHNIVITIPQAGLEAFTFTFG